MTIYFASLRLCVKFGSQRREDAKIIKDHICEKHSTTNLFCGMVLVTDSHNKLYRQNTYAIKSKKPFAETKSFSSRLKDETIKPRYELQIRN